MSTVTQASDDEADSPPAEGSPLDEVPPDVLDGFEMREIDKVAA